MANPQRGERTLTVDGEDYTLRLDFEAIARIESELGEGIGLIIQNRFGSTGMSLSDLAVVLREMLRSGGRGNIGLNEAGNLILAAGPKTVGAVIGEVLIATLGGDEGNGPAPARQTRKRASRGGA